MSFQNNMLRCPEQSEIRSQTQSEVYRRDNGSEGTHYTVSKPISYDISIENDGRRPQVRGERDGQSTDSGISDFSDKEEEKEKRNSPKVANGIATGPPNAVVLPDGTIQNISHANVNDLSSCIHTAPIRRPENVTMPEPVQRLSGKPSPSNDNQVRLKKTILNPPAGMHGSGTFRADPKIDSRFIGKDVAAAEPLDLTSNHSAKAAPKTYIPNPPSAHRHPSIVARLKQPFEHAIQPHNGQNGDVTHNSARVKSPDVLASKERRSLSHRSNSIPLPMKVNADYRPSSYPSIVKPKEHTENSYDPYKFDRGLTKGSSSQQTPLANNCIQTDLADTVSKRLFDTNMVSKPLPNGIMEQLNRRTPTSKKAPHTNPSIQPQGTRSTVTHDIQQQGPMHSCDTDAKTVSNYVRNADACQSTQPPHSNSTVLSPTGSSSCSPGVPRLRPMQGNAAHCNTSNVSPNQLGPIPQRVDCPSTEQQHQHFPPGQYCGPSMFPYQQHMGTGHPVPCGNRPQMFQYFPPAHFQHEQYYQFNIQHPNHQMSGHGPRWDNCLPNRFEAPPANNPVQVYHMTPQIMPEMPRNQMSPGGMAGEQTIHAQSNLQVKPRRKYTRRKNVAESSDITRETVANNSKTHGDGHYSTFQRPILPKTSNAKSTGSIAPTHCLATSPAAPAPSTYSTVHNPGNSITHVPKDNIPKYSPRTGDISHHHSRGSPSVFANKSEMLTETLALPTSRSDSSKFSNAANRHNLKTAEVANNMCYEGLGNKIGLQRSLSTPNSIAVTELQAKCSENVQRLKGSHTNQTMSSDRNIFEKMSVKTNERMPSDSSAEQSLRVHSQSPSRKENIQPHTQSSIDAENRTESPMDHCSSYHRNLPKKRHLFEKHLSDSNIAQPIKSDLRNCSSTEPLQKVSVEQSRPASVEEIQVYKSDINAAPDVSEREVRAPPKQHKPSAHPTTASAQPQNPGNYLQKDRLDHNTVNLNGPQLQDSSQNPRQAFPGIFNYRFHTPTENMQSARFGSAHAPQMPPPFGNQQYRPRTPQIRPYLPPGQHPSSSTHQQSRSPQQEPRFDMKERIATFLKRKESKSNAIQSQPQPSNENTGGNVPQFVRHDMHLVQCQNHPDIFVDSNGMQWRPMPPNMTPFVPFAPNMNVPSSNGLTPIAPSFMNTPGTSMMVPCHATKQANQLNGVPTGPAFKPKQPLQFNNNSKAKKHEPQSYDFSNVTFPPEISPSKRLNSGSFDSVVMNASKQRGVKGVVLNVDEQQRMVTEVRRGRGRKRKARDAALVPENVFVRAQERRKRHKLLPTPEALAGGETNLEKGVDDNSRPKSLLMLASNVCRKHRVLSPSVTVPQTEVDKNPLCANASVSPLSRERRAKTKQYEVLAENMIASMVDDACLERQYRKAGATNDTHEKRSNEITWCRGSTGPAYRSSQNMIPEANSFDQGYNHVYYQTNHPNLDITQVPSNQFQFMNIPYNQGGEIRTVTKLQQQQRASNVTSRSSKEKDWDARHYRPKRLKKPIARIEDISETIAEVIRDSVDEDINAQEMEEVVQEETCSGYLDNEVIQDDGRDFVFDVTSMGTVDVYTEPQDEALAEKERNDFLAEYEAKLKEYLCPKVPDVVNEILNDMQVELRGSLPEVEIISSDSEDSSDDSSESESDDNIDAVELGTVVLGGNEYRMRVVVDEDDDTESQVTDSDSDDSEVSENENRPSSRAYSDISYEESYVGEGVDTFQDIDMLEDDDDVFEDVEDVTEQHEETCSRSMTDVDSDEDDHRELSNKRTHSETSSSDEEEVDTSAEDETDNSNTSDEEENGTCLGSEIMLDSNNSATSDDVRDTSNDNTVGCVKEDSPLGKINPEEVYVIDDFKYTDQNGQRRSQVDEDRITDAIEIDASIAHQVDIEFIRPGEKVHAKHSENLFEKFSLDKIITRPMSPQSQDSVNHAKVSSPSNENADECFELHCPVLSSKPPEVNDMIQSLELDTSAESGDMPVLSPCGDERKTPPLSPCDEPPILQRLGQPGNRTHSSQSNNDKSPKAVRIGVPRFSSSPGIRSRFKKRKKPKMISLPLKNVSLREKENHSEESNFFPITKPEYGSRFRASSPRISYGYASEFDSEITGYERHHSDASKCEFRSLGPSPVSDSKSRPFSPINPWFRIDYCCKCRKNGKLRSPNRLHSIDELCPYSEKAYVNDISYYSRCDEVINSGTCNSRITCDDSSELKSVSNTPTNDQSGCDIEDNSLENNGPSGVICDRFDAISNDLNADEARLTDTSSFVQEEANAFHSLSESPEGREASGDDTIQRGDSTQSTAEAIARPKTASESENDRFLSLLELSSDGTVSSLYHDNNGCDDLLFSSSESLTRLSDCMNSSKSDIDQAVDSDYTLPASPRFSDSEMDGTFCTKTRSMFSNQFQKCSVDLCDIGNFLVGKSRVKICDFVSYNESLCKFPPRQPDSVISSDTVNSKSDKLEQEQRIHLLKNKLAEMQRQVNLSHPI